MPKLYWVFLSLIRSQLDKFLDKLQRECHWLESMSAELCARCTVCIETATTEPCARHEERSCRHHDCGHYIPLDGRSLCCKPGQMLDKKPLKPWIKAIKHISKVRNVQGWPWRLIRNTYASTTSLKILKWCNSDKVARIVFYFRADFDRLI